MSDVTSSRMDLEVWMSPPRAQLCQAGCEKCLQLGASRSLLCSWPIPPWFCFVNKICSSPSRDLSLSHTKGKSSTLPRDNTHHLAHGELPAHATPFQHILECKLVILLQGDIAVTSSSSKKRKTGREGGKAKQRACSLLRRSFPADPKTKLFLPFPWKQPVALP